MYVWVGWSIALFWFPPASPTFYNLAIIQAKGLVYIQIPIMSNARQFIGMNDELFLKVHWYEAVTSSW